MSDCCTGAKRNGTRPSHFCLGSASVARKALQSLEAMKLVQKDSNGGRSITPQGQKDMDHIAGQVCIPLCLNMLHWSKLSGVRLMQSSYLYHIQPRLRFLRLHLSQNSY